MKKVDIEVGYGGRSVQVTGTTDDGERVIILNPIGIILNALNEKGFKLSKKGQERLSRALINK